MELPVINPSSPTNPETILRALKKSAAELGGQNSDPVALTGATAYLNPALPGIDDANLVYDLFLPADASASEIISEIEEHFAQHQLQCHRWVPAASTLEPELAEALSTRGINATPTLALTLTDSRRPPRLRQDLQIIPARALQQEYYLLQHDAHQHDWSNDSAENMASFKQMALDDPRLDLFLARVNKKVVAAAGIYALGEIGVLHEIVTHPEFRRQGVMQALLNYVLLHGARSQFKTMALETNPDNIPAIKLYQSFGFRKLVEYATYRRP